MEKTIDSQGGVGDYYSLIKGSGVWRDTSHPVKEVQSSEACLASFIGYIEDRCTENRHVDLGWWGSDFPNSSWCLRLNSTYQISEG